MGLDWSPPGTVDILHNVHVSRKTHIKKPFHHQQFPYQYKTESYFLYNSPTPTKKNEKLDQVQEVDVELDSITPKPTTQNTKSSSIKQRIYNHQLYLFEDFVEYRVARDYCKLFNRPFNIPRQDWASPYHFFQHLIPATQNTHPSSDNTNPITRDDTGVYDDEVTKAINDLNYVDSVKRTELLRGEIPQMFDRSGLIKLRQKRDCWISYHNLRNYALMIDSVTKCPLLQVQSQTSLLRGWNTTEPPKHVDTQCVTEERDPYGVTPELMARIGEILKEREELPDVTTFKYKSYGINENCSTIGGRYHT